MGASLCTQIQGFWWRIHLEPEVPSCLSLAIYYLEGICSGSKSMHACPCRDHRCSGTNPSRQANRGGVTSTGILTFDVPFLSLYKANREVCLPPIPYGDECISLWKYWGRGQSDLFDINENCEHSRCSILSLLLPPKNKQPSDSKLRRQWKDLPKVALFHLWICLPEIVCSGPGFPALGLRTNDAIILGLALPNTFCYLTTDSKRVHLLSSQSTESSSKDVT